MAPLDGVKMIAKLPASGGLWGEVGSRVGAADFCRLPNQSSQDGAHGNIRTHDG